MLIGEGRSSAANPHPDFMSSPDAYDFISDELWSWNRWNGFEEEHVWPEFDEAASSSQPYVDTLRGAVLERPTLLAGPEEASKRVMREQENATALGGMRNPAESVEWMPHARTTGRRIRALLERFLDQHQELSQTAENIRQGRFDEHSVVFPRKHIRLLRRALLESLGAGDVPFTDNGICAAILRAYASSAGDPDIVLADWLETGAPIGIINSIPNTGVFPTVEPKDQQLPLSELVSSPCGWSNHPSAELEPERVLELLSSNVAKHHGRMFDSWDELCTALGTSDVVLNRFGLITKLKHNGKVKYRVIWDLRDSKVNEAI